MLRRPEETDRRANVPGKQQKSKTQVTSCGSRQAADKWKLGDKPGQVADKFYVGISTSRLFFSKVAKH